MFAGMDSRFVRDVRSLQSKASVPYKKRRLVMIYFQAIGLLAWLPQRVLLDRDTLKCFPERN